MRTTIKRLIFLAMTALLFVLAGCSQAAQESLSADNSDDSSSDGAGGAVEIEFWYGLGSVAGETMQEIIEEFNASQSEVKVTGIQQPSYGDTIQELQAAIAAGNAPAVFINGSVYDTVQNGMVDPMDDLPADLFNEADYLPVFWSQGDIDGTRYSLPAYGTTQVMYYRSDILEEAGIDPEEMYASWENVREYSEQLIEGGYVDAGHLPMYDKENLEDIALSNGGSFLSEDGRTVTINTPEWVEAWSFIQSGIQDNVWHVNSGGQGWEYWYNTIDEVMTGQAAGYTGSSGDKGDLDFEIIGSHIQPGLNGNQPAPEAGALQFSIPANTDAAQKEAAYQWIAYFTAPEQQAKWSQTIGYIPVNIHANEVPEYAAFLEENPAYYVPFEQAQHATPTFVDPTGGQIMDALSIAADQVELEGIDPQVALDEAQEKAQAALDEYWASQE